ncbi:MAG: Wadjet anti-phage system protein JetD domain-containing protein [Ktedonobacteraceae bacterium]
MITPTELKQRAERHYLPFLQNWLREEVFVPLSFPAGKPSTEFASLRAEVQLLQACERSATKRGYRIEWHTLQKHALSTQTLPMRIWLDTPEDLLYLIEKEDEFDAFQQDIALLRQLVPPLASWAERFPKKLIEQHGAWSGLLVACRYFLAHPRPGLYIRELPINVHTKFVEQHLGILRDLLDYVLPAEAITQNSPSFQQRYGLREEETLIHVRFLGEQLRTRYALPLNEICVPCSQLAKLDFSGQICVLTENKMTFLTLPPLPNAIALFGGGFQVGSLVAVPWLRACPILYWGDLDAQGFQILSQLRSIFPHTISLMMDETTFAAFIEFRVLGTPCRVRQLPHLTTEEHALFLRLAQEESRLEQERISHAYALQQVQNCLATLAYTV